MKNIQSTKLNETKGREFDLPGIETVKMRPLPFDTEMYK